MGAQQRPWGAPGERLTTGLTPAGRMIPPSRSDADVAQRESNAFVRRRLLVRSQSSAQYKSCRVGRTASVEMGALDTAGWCRRQEYGTAVVVRNRMSGTAAEERLR